jgi:hypothetical protein
VLRSLTVDTMAINPRDNAGPKAILIVAALLVGFAIVVSLLVYYWPPSIPEVVFFVAIGLAAAYLYVFLAAQILTLLKEIRAWAYRDKHVPLTGDEILLMGAVWPFSLVIGCIIYLFIGIINRLFEV